MLVFIKAFSELALNKCNRIIQVAKKKDESCIQLVSGSLNFWPKSGSTLFGVRCTGVLFLKVHQLVHIGVLFVHIGVLFIQ